MRQQNTRTPASGAQATSQLEPAQPTARCAVQPLVPPAGRCASHRAGGAVRPAARPAVHEYPLTECSSRPAARGRCCPVRHGLSLLSGPPAPPLGRRCCLTVLRHALLARGPPAVPGHRSRVTPNAQRSGRAASVGGAQRITPVLGTGRSLCDRE
jgi:hypothetical protein